MMMLGEKLGAVICWIALAALCWLALDMFGWRGVVVVLSMLLLQLGIVLLFWTAMANQLFRIEESLERQRQQLRGERY
jgi:NO-binding membrane sensor protein with MHYT domain